MLNDQEFLLPETIIFENLKNAAKKINDLEDLDEDLWATVPFLCDKVNGLEKAIKSLEKYNLHLKKANETLSNENTEIKHKLKNILETQNNIFKIFEKLSL